jgi:uncharacterized membrane protein (UPF0127 family)
MAAEWLSVIVALVAMVFSAGGCRPVAANGTDEPVKEKIEIAGKQYKLDVAADMVARTNGLSHRTSIDDDGGMIFIFPDTDMRSFWMKDCLVNMDLMFLDSQGRIVAMHEMAQEPPRREEETVAQYEARLKRYTSGKRAQFAIELKAGSMKQLGLSLGQKLGLDLKRLKAMAS